MITPISAWSHSGVHLPSASKVPWVKSNHKAGCAGPSSFLPGLGWVSAQFWMWEKKVMGRGSPWAPAEVTLCTDLWDQNPRVSWALQRLGMVCFQHCFPQFRSPWKSWPPAVRQKSPPSSHPSSNSFSKIHTTRGDRYLLRPA